MRYQGLHPEARTPKLPPSYATEAIGCKFCIPRYKISQQQRSIKYLGVPNWNFVSPEIRKYSFRKLKKQKMIMLKIKDHLMQSY